MKRSRKVVLALMGSAALGLTGCDDSTPVPVTDVAFSTVEECIQAGADVETCAAQYKAAVEAHADQAPRFASQSECEAGTDSACQVRKVEQPDGSFSSVFMPMMAGYMLAEALDDIGERRYHSSPVYASRSYSGSYRALQGVRGLRSSTSLTSTTGASSVKAAQPPTIRKAPPPNVRTKTVSRSGFGSSSRSFGGRVGG